MSSKEHRFENMERLQRLSLHLKAQPVASAEVLVGSKGFQGMLPSSLVCQVCQAPCEVLKNFVGLELGVSLEYWFFLVLVRTFLRKLGIGL
jgi:hypothetical protein